VGADRVISIGCFGLGFKPNVDDLRESPSVEIVALDADSILMLTDHAVFRGIPAERVAGKTLIDTRGVGAGASVTVLRRLER
jgi:UDP-N-acetyl-D-mannosaminuronic acid dehydrogenase